jgi:LPS export ABC transporter protein LptC
VKRVRLILLAALAAVLVGSFAAYWLNPPVQLPLLNMGGEPILDKDGRPRVRGLTYTQVTEGVRKWTLSAQGARFDRGSGVITLNRVELTFYPDEGGEIFLQGDQGEYDQKKKLVTLRGNVRGRTHDGMTIKTELLVYSEEKELVTTDKIVVLAGPKFKVRGKGMEVKVPKRTLVLKSEVDSVFTPEGDGPPPGVTAEDS